MRSYEKLRKYRRSVILSISVGSIFLLALSPETRYRASGATTEISWTQPTIKAEPMIPRDGPIVLSEETTVSEHPGSFQDKEWQAEDPYLLAKIAMAEAEGESIEGKTLVIFVVLNRVKSSKFPDTIHEVIYQDRQFTPVTNGCFDAVEPNDDCWAAVTSAMTSQYDHSQGALYFESCENVDNWHSQNLEFLYQVGDHRFYR